MATLNSYAYEIMELLQTNFVDDFPIDIRLVKQVIVEQRELAISNATSKGTNSNQGVQYGTGSGYDGGWDVFAQEMSVPLTLQTIITSGYSGYTNRSIWKSSSQFPRTITFGRRPSVLRVTPSYPDLSLYKPTVLFASLDRALYAGEGRLNSEQIVSFIKGDYLFLSMKKQTVEPTIASATVEAIFKDPRMVTSFTDQASEFPVGRLWPYIEGATMEALISKLNAGEDRQNNATNN